MHPTGYNLTIKLNDITIQYDDLGIGKIPIIFIHGFPFDKTSWYPQIEFLRHSNRVIAYDIRGFGKSAIGKETLSIKLFADDFINFINALGLQKVIVCGLSMGAYIVLNAISRYPDKFDGIILSDTQCIADSTEAKAKRQKTIDQIEKNGLNEFADSFVNNVFYIDTLKFKIGLAESIKNIIRTSSLRTVTETLQALAEREETCSNLSKIMVPALILCGRHDALTPPSKSEFLHANIKNSTLHIIEEAAHLSNLEQPEDFNQQLNHFISKVIN